MTKARHTVFYSADDIFALRRVTQLLADQESQLDQVYDQFRNIIEKHPPYMIAIAGMKTALHNKRMALIKYAMEIQRGNDTTGQD